jgi:hypothetical protein
VLFATLVAVGWYAKLTRDLVRASEATRRLTFRPRIALSVESTDVHFENSYGSAVTEWRVSIVLKNAGLETARDVAIQLDALEVGRDEFVRGLLDEAKMPVPYLAPGQRRVLAIGNHYGLVDAIREGKAPDAIAGQVSYEGEEAYAERFTLRLDRPSFPKSRSPREGGSVIAQAPLAVKQVKSCPDCAEPLRLEARVCRYCSFRFA